MARLCALVLLMFSSFSRAQEWKQVDTTTDGFKVEVREPKNSSFEEVRVTGKANDIEPAQLIAAVWGSSNEQKNADEVVKREVLDETENERTYYEQVRAPVVSDRDYVMRSTRSINAEGKELVVTFNTVTDKRKPPVDGIVRMPLIQGSFTARPGAEGKGTAFVYVVHSEVGGAVPAFVTRGKQRESSIEYVRAKLKRARAERKP